MQPEELQNALLRHGLFQSDMARICGVTTKTIQNWLRGRQDIPRPVALIVMALDEGALSLRWLARHIDRA
jgi:plasmid maintenance system antidote protein VapI